MALLAEGDAVNPRPSLVPKVREIQEKEGEAVNTYSLHLVHKGKEMSGDLDTTF